MNKRVRLIKLQLAFLALLLLPGCWDYKEIHHLTFVTTMGIDYKDKVFTVYLQALNFANIAQKEGLRPPQHTAVTGVGRGATVTEAMFDLYKSEQQRIYWGHISTLIISDKALKEITVEQLTDTINRYREIRYNIWVFGTSSPIEELLNTKPNFGYSPYDSNLMKPDKTYSQFSTIKPVYLYRFISQYYERGATAMLPKLELEDSHWSEGGKTSTHLRVEGAYFYMNKKLCGELSYNQLVGKRYLESRAERMFISITQKEGTVATFVLNRPKFQIKHTVQNGKVNYQIEIQMTGYLDELIQEMSQDTMNALVQQKVAQQVRQVYEAGKKINADVLNLNVPVFRYDYNTWKAYLNGTGTDNMAIASVKVRVLIKYTGKYKARLD